MLTVITPATSTALTTVTRARAVLDFPLVDDGAASMLIAQASRVITDHCRQTFALETVRQVFGWDETRGDGPILARGPVVEILSVSSGGTVLPGSEYAVDTRTGRLRRLDADGTPLAWWGGSLAIDYCAGYVLPSDSDGAPASTLPESIERAAILLLGSYLSQRGRDVSIKSDAVEGVGSTSYWVPGASDRLVSPEAEQLLADYRRFWP
ncbi:hypothetical protein [Methylobacterium gnaphalii]|uniref:Phage gp6-like head-tail connector protein n=1 Tax=Methylobacterium gnaphalii TaxID=1010610 RepID=A0A512JH32_9HYPH|nr:hypothetical protein [Methylobacterium gnaphalii]GEP09278.1 hypothetical protein MGN01_11230 [Methylobacterium gnaphalii]GJD69059.1 hypothetical protein MMMDOFMJ_1985 [Methylobacterium gnaphalii]GLS50989.1 hypothetical protein GCM10007885_38430 [Methylobacterium gnaphalii]